MWFCIVIVLIIFIIIYTFVVYNSFIKLNNKVKEAFSIMDVYLKKRWDLIPNIVQTVKGYAKFEKDTLEEIINLRNRIYDNMSLEDKLKANEEITKSINKIMILTENYPDLKANANFKDLSKQLIKVEDEIANSRKYYNATIRIFNNKVEIFPNNIFAKLFGYKPKTMFEVRELEKENIKVEL